MLSPTTGCSLYRHIVFVLLWYSYKTPRNQLFYSKNDFLILGTSVQFYSQKCYNVGIWQTSMYDNWFIPFFSPGDLSDDEEDEFAIFSSTDKKDSSSNLYSMGLNNKTTWKTKVDSSKPAATLHQGEQFDVYAEPVFGMRLM